MDALLRFLGAIALLAIVIFVMPLVGVVVGAFAGWVVGLFYSETFHAFREALGIGPIAPWQAGAMLGFIAAFFRSYDTKSKS